VALFSAGSGTVNVSGAITASTLGFVPGAGAYTVSVGPSSSLNLNGTGFINTSAALQNLEGNSGTLNFLDRASAGTAQITNDGATVNGGAGGNTQFLNSSTAGSARMVNNGGSNGGMGGGTFFRGTSDGGTASVTNNGNGFLDISGLTSTGMKIGSIAGSGTFFLGSKTLRRHSFVAPPILR
jgi:hypothetical protein